MRQCIYTARINKLPSYPYSIDGNILSTVTTFIDLGVTYNNHLEFSIHIDKIVHLASTRAKLIRKCFCTNNHHILMRAFNTFVRPILEYASPIWSPSLKKDINKIESVQRRFTKYLPGMFHKQYTERLCDLHCDLLERRRINADVIFCNKIVKNKISFNSKLTLNTNSYTRGHHLKLYKQRYQKTKYMNLYFYRIVNIWNSLPVNVVYCNSDLSFKHNLSKIDLSNYLKGGTQ